MEPQSPPTNLPKPLRLWPGVVAAAMIVVLAANYLPVWAAKGVAILVSFVVTFSITHFVVFRARPDAAGEPR